MRYNLIQQDNNAKTLVEQVLANRGLFLDEIQRYLNPTAEECFDPNELDNIQQAAILLLSAMVKQEDIYIQVDSDCDGYTSAATLINYLYRVFPSTVQNHIFYGLHEDKHHGIKVDNIPKTVTLVIAPDSSSNEADIHNELAAKGIKTIVLDHHHADLEVVDAAIIVNNQTCNYPNKGLSGVGIVYKFCKVMDKLLGVSYADDFLDLVAIGMIADMMDLRCLETRYLTHIGCMSPKNPFVTGIMEKNDFKIQGQLTPFTVSWYVSPFVNAMCRSGSLAEKTILFRSMLEYEAGKLIPSTKKGGKGQEETILTQALRTAGNVKTHQDTEKKNALASIRNYIQEQEADKRAVIIVQVDYELDSNLNGLIANQIMPEYQKPTLILTKREKMNEETGEIITTWEGSARGYAIDDITDWRKFILQSGWCEYAEGHPMAFGVGFTPEKLEGFKEFIDYEFGSCKMEVTYPVDFIWRHTDDIDNNILELANYRHIWGQGVKEPYVVLQDIPITKEKFLLQGKGTLKVLIPNSKTTCIKFGFGEQAYDEIYNMIFADDGAAYITILGKCTINTYYGTAAPQIDIENFTIKPYAGWYF